MKESPNLKPHRKRILVVDDTPDLLEGLCEFLKMEEYDVCNAPNGKEALTVLEEREIDLVITDLLMPVMDGFDLIKSIRADERFRLLPIIVFSAKPRTENQQQALDTGADRFVTKPSPLDSILMMVKELVE